jgi:hypothetical protein
MAYRVRVIPRKKRRTIQHETTRKTSCDLQVIETFSRPLVKERVFSDLPGPVLAALDAISLSATYPKNAILFAEGQEANAVLVVSSGSSSLRIRLTESPSSSAWRNPVNWWVCPAPSRAGPMNSRPRLSNRSRPNSFLARPSSDFCENTAKPPCASRRF